MTEIVKQESKALMTWEEEMAAEAKKVAAKEVVFTQRLGFKGGDIILPSGDKAANKKLPVIIVDYAIEKSYYEGPYDPSNTSSPVCYAIADRDADEAELKPHPKSSKPQAETCKVCPHNEMGSADVGKGKACKDKRRLMVMAGNSTADEVPSTDILMATIAPTSIKNLAKYVNTLSDEFGSTPWGVATLLGMKPEKNYHVVTFELIGKLAKEQYMAVRQRQKSIQNQMFVPYPEPKEEGSEETPRKKRKF